LPGCERERSAAAPKTFVKRGRWDGLCLAFGLANAILYSSLLPLWEGFDEPFHFAYVEFVATQRALPVFGHAGLSQQVEESIRLAPASHVVRQNIPYVMTFAEYHALPDAERAARRRALYEIPAERRGIFAAGSPNYENHQAPLAYLLQAPLSALWASSPLPVRVLRLRWLISAAAVAALFAALCAASSILNLSPLGHRLMLFWVFCWQVLYAATAHVANDWLSVPLSAWFFVALLRFEAKPERNSALALGGVLGAGLLAKASFLPWLALAGCVTLWLVIRKRARLGVAAWLALPVLMMAGPWHVRNILLYGSLSGMYQSARGIALADVLAAAVSLPWGEAVRSMIHTGVWTGNNTFNTFSVSTVGVVAGLFVIGLVLWAKSAKRSTGEVWLAAGLCLFAAAVLYACCLFWAYRPGAVSVAPWYLAMAALPFTALAALGMERGGKAGRWAAAALAGLSAYMISATYVIKLIPQYAGCGAGATRPAGLKSCYIENAGRTAALLADTALGPGWLVFGLTAIVVILAAGLAAGIFWRYRAAAA
jgi:hypothetical protein